MDSRLVAGYIRHAALDGHCEDLDLAMEAAVRRRGLELSEVFVDQQGSTAGLAELVDYARRARIRRVIVPTPKHIEPNTTPRSQLLQQLTGLLQQVEVFSVSPQGFAVSEWGAQHGFATTRVGPDGEWVLDSVEGKSLGTTEAPAAAMVAVAMRENGLEDYAQPVEEIVRSLVVEAVAADDGCGVERVSVELMLGDGVLVVVVRESALRDNAPVNAMALSRSTRCERNRWGLHGTETRCEVRLGSALPVSARASASGPPTAPLPHVALPITRPMPAVAPAPQSAVAASRKGSTSAALAGWSWVYPDAER